MSDSKIVSQLEVDQLLAHAVAMIQSAKDAGYGKVMGTALFAACVEGCRRTMPADRFEQAQAIGLLIANKAFPAEPVKQ